MADKSIQPRPANLGERRLLKMAERISVLVDAADRRYGDDDTGFLKDETLQKRVDQELLALERELRRQDRAKKKSTRGPKRRRSCSTSCQGRNYPVAIPSASSGTANPSGCCMISPRCDWGSGAVAKW
jgi:hypothetical protein